MFDKIVSVFIYIREHGLSHPKQKSKFSLSLKYFKNLLKSVSFYFLWKIAPKSYFRRDGKYVFCQSFKKAIEK